MDGEPVFLNGGSGAHPQPFHLPKSVWTEFDFAEMSWHDVFIHAIGWSFNDDGRVSNSVTLYLDIDYMFEWVNPEPPSRGLTFWIAPCTLVFFNVNNPSINMTDLVNSMTSGIARKQIGTYGTQELWQFEFDMVCNEPILLESTGFTQFTRMSPVRCAKQRLSFKERGGLSFDSPQSLS